jgi:hypothetical protein
VDGETVELTPHHRIGSGIRTAVPDTRSAVFTSCPHQNLTGNAANSAAPDRTQDESEPEDLADCTVGCAAADVNGSVFPNHSTKVVVERGR